MTITREQALEIAKRRLAQEGGDTLVIREDQIIERDFGWVFVSTSRAFLETSDPNKAIPGFGPLVVDKTTGATEFISSSGALEAGLDHFERIWRDRQRTA